MNDPIDVSFITNEYIYKEMNSKEKCENRFFT